jgi:ComF family protein
MNNLNKIITSTLHLFYPHLCNGCGSDVLSNDNLLCFECFNKLPHTLFEQYPNNPIEKIFWGRLNITSAFAQFYFDKESLIQHLVHQLKYKNNTDIGIYLGEMMGNSILKSERLQQFDALVPLPLFPNKERKRGYNQAKIICDGISKVTNIAVVNNVVVRQLFTETQTRKHRTERWENVADSFAIKNAEQLQSKHILLVDDVVTTGATLEACGSKILQIPNTKLSIATLAVASK